MKALSYKQITLACVLCITVLQANLLAATEYHDFLLKDGRSFRGRIVAYDHHTDIVKIETDDNRLIKTSPAVFDEADQLRIKEWYILRDFMSDRLLELSTTKQPYKEKTNLTRGQVGRIHGVRYIISIKNKSNISLKNMQLEYGIYYNRRKVNLSSDSGNRGVEHEKVLFNLLKPKSRNELKTVGVVVQTSGPTPNSIPPRINKIYVEGIWIRITLPLSGGRELIRDYCHPDSLSKHLTWADEDIPFSTYSGPLIGPINFDFDFDFGIDIGK